MKENYIETTQPNATSAFRRVSWGAIFAGVIVTTVLQLLFTLLGAGIGAAAVDPLHQSNPGKGMGTGAAVWFLVSTLISVYIGARVAGSLSGPRPRSERVLHGILTWGTTAVASLVFLTSAAGGLMGGAGSFLGAATAARTQSAYAGDQPAGQAQLDKIYSGSSQTKLSATGRDLQEAPASDEQRMQQAQNEQRAREAGDVAAKRVSHAALWTFFVLLLAGITAAFGGRSGNEKSGVMHGEFPPVHQNA